MRCGVIASFLEEERDEVLVTSESRRQRELILMLECDLFLATEARQKIAPAGARLS
jgi:hypothetical protein